MVSVERIIFKGYLTTVFPDAAFGRHLSNWGALLKDPGTFFESEMTTLIQHAKATAVQARRPYLYLASAHTHASGRSKEAMARAIAEQDEITESLLCIFSVIEACASIAVVGNRKAQRLVVVRRNCRCLEMETAGELTLGADVRVHGADLNIGGSFAYSVPRQRLINLGGIEADTSGRRLQVLAETFTNEGLFKASGGAILSLSNLQPNAGIIQASDGGLVSVSGDFSNLATGTVRLGIGGIGTASNGRLNITGSATLDGTLSVFTTNAFVPSVGQDYTLLSFASRTGTFATLRDENPADGVTFVELDASLNVTLSVVAG